ncbi:hypothetical protein LLH00_10835 [bacterium]|nr:hypothetical protein [bacterium]
MLERKKHSTHLSRAALLALAAAVLLGLACNSGDRTASPLAPTDGGDVTDGGGSESTAPAEVELDLRLTVSDSARSGGTALAVANDGTFSDSTHLYIDVQITNLGPEVVYVSTDFRHINLHTRLSFVDVPWLHFFDRGRLEIVIGQTETGYQASEKLDFKFLADTTLSFEMPVTRVDTFKVADNVAVWGTVLAKDRFVRADSVKAFTGSTLPAGFVKPDLVGYVRSADLAASRLYVSAATVVIDPLRTKVYDTDGRQTGIEMLNDGRNRLTVTALAWGYDLGGGMIANGWEFRNYEMYVARPLNP